MYDNCVHYLIFLLQYISGHQELKHGCLLMNDTNVFTNQLSKVNFEDYYKIHVLVFVLTS